MNFKSPNNFSKSLKFSHGSYALLFAILVLAPALAIAQGIPVNVPTNAADYAPPDKDFTNYVLKAIFGEWNSSAPGGSNTDTTAGVLGAPMRVLNLFALSFGTLMFTYITIVGTLNTAQDGVALGNRWNSMMVPLRFVLGTGLLVPLATGYSAIQHFIIWLALVGGGAASIVWNSAMTSFTSPLSAAQSVQKSADYNGRIDTLSRNLFKSRLCIEMFGSQLNPATYGGFGVTTTTPFVNKILPDSDQVLGATYKWGSLNPDLSGKPHDVCGSLSTKTRAVTPLTNKPFGTSSFDAALAPLTSRIIQDGDSAYLSNIAYTFKAVINAQAAAISKADVYFAQQIQSSGFTAKPELLTSVAVSNLIKGGSAIIKAELNAPIADAQVATAYRMSKFIESTKDTGWMMASTSFFQISRIRGEANKILDDIPEFNNKVSDATAQRNSAPGVTDGPMFDDINNMQTKIDNDFKDEDQGWFDIGHWMRRMALGAGRIITFDPESKSPAIVQIKDSGDYLLVTTEAIAGGMVLAAGAIGVADGQVVGKVSNWATGAIDAAKLVFSFLTPAIYLGLISLFSVAITMSFVIPLLPFMLSVGNILGWLMAVFSAVVAAPIWIAGHLHPEGDGFAGKGIGGYMILLETVTRPIFMIMGLLGAFVIMDPMLKFVSFAYSATMATMSSVQGHSTTGIISMIVFAILYCVIVFTTIKTSLGLIHTLGEKVYTWIGGQNAGYDQSQNFGGAAQQGAASATEGMKGVGAAGAGGVAALRQKREKAKKFAGERDKGSTTASDENKFV